MLEADPSIRWQALRDLADAPAEVVAAERVRVATEGWGARLLALQGDDGQWEGGALFPGGWWDRPAGGHWTEHEGQPWTATEPTLTLLRAFGVDPNDERVRRAVEQVRDHCRWEHEGQAFFDGEVEPCINGRTVALGVYFGQDVEGIVERLVGEQLEDGGWNCEAERGSVRSSFDTTINVLEGLLAHERATGGSAGSDRGATPGRGVPARTEAVPAQEHGRGRRPGLAGVLVPDPLALRRAACARVLPGGRRSAGPAGGRGDAVAPIQAAARRDVAAREHASRQGPFPARGRRRSAQPVEHAPGAACAPLVRAIRWLSGPSPPFGAAARARRASGRARTRTRTDRRSPARRPWRRRG